MFNKKYANIKKRARRLPESFFSVIMGKVIIEGTDSGYDGCYDSESVPTASVVAFFSL
jgi:hypothetical protein